MAGEMQAKLLLNSKDFDSNLKKSKKNAEQFKQQGSAMGDALAKSFGKITAAALTIKTADAAFKAFIGSSQTLTDGFEASMAALTNVTENFVYALANADFSIFTDGLDEMIRKSKEAHAAYDQLNNTMMASSYIQATEGAKYKEAMVRALDKSLPIDERRQALKEARAAGKEISTAANVTATNSLNALKKQIAADTNLDVKQISEATIEKYFDLDATEAFEEQRKELESQYKKYLQKVEDIKDDNPIFLEKLFGAGSNKKGKNEKIREKLISEAREEFKDVIVGYQLLFREADEELAKMYKTAESAVAARNQAAEIAKSTNEASNSIDSAAKKMEDDAKKLAEANAILQSEYNNFYANLRTFDTSVVSINPKGELPKTIKPIELPALSLSDDKGFDFSETTEGITSLTSAFRELNGVLSGTDDEMKVFVDNIFKSIDAIIPFISYLAAETTAHKTNTNAATADAVAKGVAAHAGIPFAGIALGLTAAASIISTIRSVPKFAQGAVVTRATLGVFGEAGPEAVMPLDKIRDYIGGGNIHLTGEFKQRGKDLVATIDSYKQTQKVK